MPCSSHIIILIPDCYSFFDRGGCGYRAKDLLPSQDLDRKAGAGLGCRSLHSHGPQKLADRSAAVICIPRAEEYSSRLAIDHDRCVEHERRAGAGRDSEFHDPDARLPNF